MTVLDADDLAAVLRPFGSSRMLPGPAYAAQPVFAWEQQHLFAGSWVCAGRSSEVGSPGSQRAVSAGPLGVLLVRDSAGVLRAFANVCRHRGHELLPAGAAAERPAVRCPYHAWSYRLDGSLHAAPRLAGAPEDDLALVPLPAVEWHGWTFVNADGRAPDFADHVAGLDEIVAPYDPGTLVAAATREYVVGANWKLIHENYHECYHCPQIHPELCAVSPPTSGRNFAPGRSWVGGTMELRDGAATMSLDGTSAGRPLRSLPESRHREVAYVGLVPDLLLSLHPDYVLSHRLEPVSPTSTRVVCEWLFEPDVVAAAGFDARYAVEFWDVTNRQDWAACESVQRGVSSPHYRPGPLTTVEDAVYHFETMVARAYLAGSVPGDPSVDAGAGRAP
ncbi:MAG TPA: aromatic ring-hydroxylating dioxygenase subunit alpha [Mycobacteriales bacterium]|jgi:Rieske 2Fe-2S family protein|nr:aromatic ring-hydroxylating dioxygenase subunit alpha [Mycobacteriales bacterium]